MSKVVEHRKFVCADAKNNNNKFWEYFLYEDGNVVVKYGRVGKTCTEDPPKKISKTELERKIREKVNGRGTLGSPSYKAPYKEIEVVADSIKEVSPTSVAKDVVQQAAKEQLAGGNQELSSLIERLVEANKHELYQASGGQLNLDLKTGIVSTPIGVITKSTVDSARIILSDIEPFIAKKDFDSDEFINLINEYLMKVPQMVGHARGWHKSFFNSHNTIQRQSSLLDQLYASAELAADRLEAAKNQAVQTTISSTPNLFKTDLKIITDQSVIDMITKKFYDTLNKSHTSKNLKPIKFYEVKNHDGHVAYEKDGAKLDNQWLLWHGTRTFNVLSILKNGLMLPKTIAKAHITGAMFGDGIYASDQSTKALNYAYGYWDRGAKDNNCFMFLIDMAMGNYYTPKSSYETLPKKGYDSTFAKGNESGVLNNEMIVYRASQANIRYLIEFSA